MKEKYQKFKADMIGLSHGRSKGLSDQVAESLLSEGKRSAKASRRSLTLKPFSPPFGLVLLRMSAVPARPARWGFTCLIDMVERY